jgi:serine/tyrosine/threonine adenylyltransferase
MMDASQPSFSITFDRLPGLFFRHLDATPVSSPRWLLRNDRLAARLGISDDWFRSDAALQALAGNARLPGAIPLAMAYSGHQFGGWAPLLGDGRALLVGEIVAPDGSRFDLHLKGSGPTPYSRNGDGRAALGPMLREYIVSEAFAGLGIPTTRSLAVVATGDDVYRRQKEPGGVLTRVAKSHVRVGTFQLAAANQDVTAIKQLMHHELARNFGTPPDTENPAQWFLRQVIARQSVLIAQWMAVGFIHGVMNTDNMQVAGETIDFGPCAFMDVFHPQKVFSSIDHHGRYAWDKQPNIAQWNLTRVAESLLPLLDDEQGGGHGEGGAGAVHARV